MELLNFIRIIVCIVILYMEVELQANILHMGHNLQKQLCYFEIII